jgi:hypothetical protein
VATSTDFGVGGSSDKAEGEDEEATEEMFHKFTNESVPQLRTSWSWYRLYATFQILRSNKQGTHTHT